VTEIRSRNRNLRSLGERLAINTVVQGSAADLIKLAMRELDARLEGDDALDAHMIIQVHDELVFDVHEEHAERAKAVVVEEMTGAMELDVPLAVDAAIGANWVESKD
jgi:DNA polymerase-1